MECFSKCNIHFTPLRSGEQHGIEDRKFGIKTVMTHCVLGKHRNYHHKHILVIKICTKCSLNKT